MSARYDFIQQKPRGPVLPFLFVGILVLTAVLFTVKTSAMQAKSAIRALEHELAQERAQMQMLTAEIAHLQSPARLRKLASEHLGLEPVKAAQIISLEQAELLVPKRAAAP